jgi:hypothetical protein
MGKKSPPPPDYAAAAREQAAASKENIQDQTWANRPNQNTPWGSSTWGQQVVKDPITGQDRLQWTQTEKLDPTLQGALQNQIDLMNKRSTQANDMYDRAGALLSDPFNPYLGAWGQNPGDLNLGLFGGRTDVNQGYLNNDEINDLRQKSEDAMYQRQINRLDPQFEQERDRKEAQLAAQGLRPTDPAYQQQMDQFNRGRNDAYEQARLGSIGEGRNEYTTMFGTGLQAQQFGNQAAQQNFANAMQKQGFNNQQIEQMWNAQLQNSNYQNQLRQAQMAEQLMMRNQPLNEINALIHGQQVSSPQFSNFANAGLSDTPNLLGAAGAQYKADQQHFSNQNAGLNSLLGGLGQIGGMFGMFSDRRLKRNIQCIGEVVGLPVYSFEYLWGEKAVGFMADEVAEVYPDAVYTHTSGFKWVNLGAVG